MIKEKRIGTKTSKFGVPGRINHDSSQFYSSRLYEELPKEKKGKYEENKISDEYLDSILCKSSEYMDELPDNSIHLMITSPPYNVGKEYDKDLSLSEYRDILKRVWKETYRVLVPGGRVCINIANLGRKPYLPLHTFIIKDMIEIGFLMRGEIIWNKGTSASPSTAWGSWLSAKNPTLRDIHEYILVFSKDVFRRDNPKKRKSTISKEAIKTNRHYIGYEINGEYVKLSKKRAKQFIAEFKSPKLFDYVKEGEPQTRHIPEYI